MVSYLVVLSLFFVLPICSSSIPIAVRLSVSDTLLTNRDVDLYEVATGSVARAHHIKRNSSSSSSTPLVPHSYGGYSISVGFGTPPQVMSLIMDTGSDFVWFPCTRRYACNNCSQIHAFAPKQSSSAQIVGCLSQKCGWVHRDFDPARSCRECRHPGSKCTQICPPYLITYGSGSTGGIGLIETLEVGPHTKVPNFLVGCSLFSSMQAAAGIAGFGRGPASLPAQLGLAKFSYCLVSRRLDDTNSSSPLVLEQEQEQSKKKSAGFSYTPLVKNPDKPAYYYVGLRRIILGGKRVKIPYKHLAGDGEGNGGTIVDSGTTFTFVSSAVFHPLLSAFTAQVVHHDRATGVESSTGLAPCYNVSQGRVQVPDLELHFRGGARMKLPLSNVFASVASRDVVCLAMVSADMTSGGPSIILGSFQMQNYNVEFDLHNNRFGFKQQTCK